MYFPQFFHINFSLFRFISCFKSHQPSHFLLSPLFFVFLSFLQISYTLYLVFLLNGILVSETQTLLINLMIMKVHLYGWRTIQIPWLQFFSITHHTQTQNKSFRWLWLFLLNFQLQTSRSHYSRRTRKIDQNFKEKKIKIFSRLAFLCHCHALVLSFTIFYILRKVNNNISGSTDMLPLSLLQL